MSSSEDRHPVEVLAEEFLARKQRGEKPTLAEYMAKYPELADEIRDVFPALLMMEDLGGSAAAASAAESAAPGSSTPRQIGDYRILREVGRGGMGVVYEAEQESLGRRVALKVLPAHALMDNKQIRRFEREAKAAARLHHTNIVPVFGVGHEVGAHYYVMQFIQGLGLDAVLEELQRLKVKKQIQSSMAGKPPSQPAASQPTPKRGMAATGDYQASAASQPKDAADDRDALTGSVTQLSAKAPRPPGPRSQAPDLSAVNIAQSLVTGVFVAAQPEGEDANDKKALAAPTVTMEPAAPPDTSANLSGDHSQLSGLSESGQRYWQSVARIGLQVAQALEYAHGQGILHRDIKPSNLLLDLKGTVWVTDFGLAKSNDAEDLTHTGDIVGTVRYMAPERFRGDSDASSDIYALGLTLYEMIALKPAFPEKDRTKLMQEVMHGEPTRLRKINAAVPRDLETIVHKAIAHDKVHRYRNAGEVAEDLQRYLEDRPIQAREVSLRERAWRWCRRNPALAAWTGLAVAALLAVTVMSALFGMRQADFVQELRTEQGKTLREQKNTKEALGKAETLAATLNKTVVVLRQHLSREAADKGRGLVESGQAQPGLLWMARALELADNDEARERIRLQMGSLPGATPVLRQVVKHGDEVTQALSSPDGHTLATLGNDHGKQSVRLWDAATGAPRGRPLTQGGRVLCLAFSPDSAVLLTGGDDGFVRGWQTDSGKRLPLEVEHDGQVSCLAVSPDGKTVLSGGSDDSFDEGTGAALLWEYPSGKLLHTFEHELPITAVAFNPSGAMCATAGLDKTMRFWDTATGKPQGKVDSPAEIVGMAFSPDLQHVVTACKDNQVRRWQGTPQNFSVIPFDHQAPLGAIAISQDGQYLASAGQGTVRLWSLRDGQLLDTSFTAAPGVAGISFHSDGKQLFLPAEEGLARLWEIPDGRQARMPIKTVLNQGISQIRVGPQGREISLHSQGREVSLHGKGISTEIRDLFTGNLVAEPLRKYVKWGDVTVNGIAALSNDGSKVIVGVSGQGKSTLELRDLRTRTVIGSFPGAHTFPAGVVFSPDDKKIMIVSLGTYLDGGYQTPSAQLWDVATMRPIGKPLLQGPEVTWAIGFNGQGVLLFSPDGGKVLMAGTNRTLRVWDVATGQLLKQLTIHKEEISAAAFSPDGKLLATGSYDSTVRLWDVATWAPALPAINVPGRVESVAFSPDGNLLAAGSADGAARLWDSHSGQPVGVPLVHPKAVTCVQFDADGKTLLTGCQDGQVRFWRAAGKVNGDVAALLAWVRQTTGMVLSPDGTVTHLDPADWRAAATRVGAGKNDNPFAAQIADSDWRMLQAQKCLAGGNTTGAIWHLNRQLRLEPENAKLYVLGAVAYRTRNNQPAAQADLKRALELDPIRATEHFVGYALTTFFDNRPNAATGQWYLDEIIAQGTKSPLPFISRAEQHQRFKVWNKAADDYGQAAKLSQEPGDLWRRRGWALSRLGQWDEAAASYLKSAAVYQQLGGGQVNREQRLRVLGELTSMDQAFEKAVAQQPKMADLWLSRGTMLAANRGQLEEAVTAFDRAIELAPKLSASHVERGNLRARLSNWQSALADFRKAVELEPSNLAAWLRLAAVHLHQDDLAEYRRVCADMVKRFEDTADPADALAIAEICLLPDAGLPTGSVQTILERCSGLPGAELVNGMTLFREGRFQEAQDQWTRTLVQPPATSFHSVFRAYAALAFFYTGSSTAFSGWHEYARRSWQSFASQPAKQNPDWMGGVLTKRAAKDVEALGLPLALQSLLGSFKDVLRPTDRKDKVRVNCVAKVHEYPLRAGQLYQIDMIGKVTGNLFDPYLRIEDAAGHNLAEDDDSGGDHNARILFTPGKNDKYRLIATTCDPNQSGAYTLEIHQGGTDDTVLLTKALARWPKNAPLGVRRAFQLAERQAWAEAAKLFKTALEVDPTDHWPWYQAGAVNLALGDLDEYRRICREMLARFADTKEPFVAERTGKSCLMIPDAVGDLKPALALIKFANSSDKNNFASWFVMAQGLAYYRQGEFQRAVDLLDALEKTEKNPAAELAALIEVIRGLAYQQLGNIAKAYTAQTRGETRIDNAYPGAKLPVPLGANWWADFIRYQTLNREMNDHWEKTYTKHFKEDSKEPEMWAGRADWRARHGKWDLALGDFVKAVELSPEDAWLGYRLALTQLALGKTDAYRRTVRALAKRFVGAADNEKVHRFLFTSFYVPDAADNAEAMVAEARRLQKMGGPESAVGAALVRAGKHEEALSLLAGSHAWNWSFAALAHQHLGHAGEAKKYLALVKAWMAEADRNPFAVGSNRWADPYQRIEFQTLVGEIERLMKE